MTASLHPSQSGIVTAYPRRPEVVKATAQLHHRCIHRQQRLRRHRSERHDHLRLDHRDLPHQKRRAGLALLALRRAIARRAALHDVRDVDLLARDPHRFDHVVEQLPGAPHEGLALRVFIGARPLADEHQLGGWIAHAKHNLLPPLLMKRAARAVAQVFADDLQRLHRIAHTLLGLQRDYLKYILFNDTASRPPRPFVDSFLLPILLICRNRNFCFVHSCRRCNFLGAVRQRPPVKIVDPHFVVDSGCAPQARVRSSGSRVRGIADKDSKLQAGRLFTTETQSHGEIRRKSFAFLRGSVPPW